MLYSEVMEEQLLDNIRDLLGCIYKSGSDVERCIRAIKDNAYEPFLDYKKAVANTIKAFYNLKDVNLDTKSYSLILRVLEITEIYWDFRNAITFSCDLKKNKFSTDKLDNLKMRNLLNDLQEMGSECIVVNCKKEGYNPIVLRLSKSGFKLGLKSNIKPYNTYCLTISNMVTNNLSKYEGKSISVYIIPELYSKIFVDKPYFEAMQVANSDFCRELVNCSGVRSVDCIITNEEFDNSDKEFDKWWVEKHGGKTEKNTPLFGESLKEGKLCYKTNDFSIIPYGLRNNKEYIGSMLDSIGIYFEEAIQICFFCLDKYINRRKIYKKGKVRDDGLSMRVTLPEETNSKSSALGNKKDKENKAVKLKSGMKVISLNDIVVYERTHKTYLGGHHASPREHYRSGYWRQYKSGKRVWIKPVTVNKGKKQKVLYKA